MNAELRGQEKGLFKELEDTSKVTSADSSTRRGRHGDTLQPNMNISRAVFQFERASFSSPSTSSSSGAAKKLSLALVLLATITSLFDLKRAYRPPYHSSATTMIRQKRESWAPIMTPLTLCCRALDASFGSNARGKVAEHALRASRTEG